MRAAEVAATRRRFELARFDLVHHLNQLETKKKFQLVSTGQAKLVTPTILHYAATLAVTRACADIS